MIPPIRRLALLPIRVYQLAVSSWLPGSCRFLPTCSEYAAEAIRRHGLGKGGWLAARRLCRCHPWGGCGFDPVPGSMEDEQSVADGYINDKDDKALP